LLRYRLYDTRVAVTQGGGEYAGKEIQVFFAIRVPHRCTCSLNENHRFLVKVAYAGKKKILLAFENLPASTGGFEFHGYVHL